MWNLFRCRLSGQHSYGVGCEPGAIFLRCVHCGHRSPGWTVDQKAVGPRAVPVARPQERQPLASAPMLAAVAPARIAGRIIPFQRSAAR